MSRRDADIRGASARAWRLRIETTRPHGTVAGWLVFAPGRHPLWAWWGLSVVHLRAEPGLPDPKLHAPGMTHELVIAAIDPARCPEPDPDARTYPLLHPLDVVEQFAVRDDATARGLAERCARAITENRLSPDQDYRRAWHSFVQLAAAGLRAEAKAAQA